MDRAACANAEGAAEEGCFGQAARISQCKNSQNRSHNNLVIHCNVGSCFFFNQFGIDSTITVMMNNQQSQAIALHDYYS